MKMKHTKKSKDQIVYNESEEKYKAIFETAANLITSVDRQGNIVDCNNRIEEVLGYTRDEIIGQNMSMIIHPVYRQKATESLSEVLHKGVSYNKEYIFVRKDGIQRHMSINSSGLKDSLGAYVKTICILEDITERKQVEAALEAEKNKAQNYLELAAVMLLSLDTDGIVTLINPKGCEILGYKKEEILGKNWLDNFIPDHFKQEVKNVFRGVYSGQTEPVQYHINPVLTKQGIERDIAWHNTLLKDGEGGIIGVLSSGEDVTERKKAEKELHKYKDHLEQIVKERTRELEKKNKELEKFNKLFIGREFRIKELRDEIKQLKQKLNPGP